MAREHHNANLAIRVGASILLVVASAALFLISFLFLLVLS